MNISTHGEILCSGCRKIMQLLSIGVQIFWFPSSSFSKGADLFSAGVREGGPDYDLRFVPASACPRARQGDPNGAAKWPTLTGAHTCGVTAPVIRRPLARKCGPAMVARGFVELAAVAED
jgi:hypothetical protein